MIKEIIKESEKYELFLKYESKALYKYCMMLAHNNFVLENKRRPTDKQRLDDAHKIQKELIKKAKTYILENIEKYNNELYNPYKVFYLKEQKTYLKNETVKKYIPYMEEIFKNNESIKELNLATRELTKGKFETFNDYFMIAFYNKLKKMACELAKKEIEESEKNRYIN